MPGVLFDAVAAGGGGAAALGFLARAEHSRRLACAYAYAYAYAVTLTAREAGGAVAERAGHAWELLTAAAHENPTAAAAVLTHPAAGPALFGLLARLMREDAQKEVSVRWFTALAASADHPRTRGDGPVPVVLALAAALLLPAPAGMVPLGRWRTTSTRSAPRAREHGPLDGGARRGAQGWAWPVAPWSWGPAWRRGR